MLPLLNLNGFGYCKELHKLKEKFRREFSSRKEDSDGITICLRSPDASKAHVTLGCAASTNVSTCHVLPSVYVANLPWHIMYLLQVLYKLALATFDIQGPFNIFNINPRFLVPPDLPLNDVGITTSCVLVIEESSDAPDPLDMFGDCQVLLCW